VNGKHVNLAMNHDPGIRRTKAWGSSLDADKYKLAGKVSLVVVAVTPLTAGVMDPNGLA
jgi:hypothetical protein